MATVPLPSTTKKASTAAVAAEPPPPALPSERVQDRVKRERRGLSRGLILLVLMAIGVYFLPDLVGRTSLRQSVPQLLLPNWRGSVALGETSLGWFVPIDIRNLILRDREGQTLATVDHLRSSKTLWELITHPYELGEFRFEKTTVHLELNDQSTNWDASLADLSTPTTSTSSRRSQWDLQFLQTSMLMRDAKSGLEHTLNDIDITVSQGITDPSTVSVTAQFPPHDGQQDPALAVTTALAPHKPPSIQLAAHDFDLVQLEPFWQLVSPLGVVRGRVSGTLNVDVTSTDGIAWSVTSDLEIRDGTAAGWDFLAGDVLQLASTQVRGHLVRNADQLVCERIQLQTDFAKLGAQGTCQWPTAGAIPTSTDAAWQAFGEDFLVTASLDVSKAAQRMPRFLRLRPGVAITSGQIQASLQTIKDENGSALSGSGRFVDLAATIDGQERRWTAPIDANLLLRPSSDGIQCDRLSLQSDFCQIQGQGTTRAGRFRITADLDRLWQELAPLVDWEGGSLAGIARLDGTIERHDTVGVTLHIDGQGDGLRYGPATQPLWSEPKITITGDVVGQGPNSAPWSSLSSGKLILKSGDDHCEMQLLDAVDWSNTAAVLPLSLEMTGEWSRWQTRLQPFWSDPSITIAGNGSVQAKLTYSSTTIAVQSATVKSQPLSVSLPGWQMQDPAFESTFQGVWDSQTRTWTTPSSKARGEWGEIVWMNGRADVSKPIAEIAGHLDLNVNVGRLSRWQQGDVQHHLLGQLTGTVDLRPTGDRVQGDIDLHLSNAILAGLSSDPQPRWIALWREPDFQVKGNVQHQHSATAWDVSSLQLSASGLTVSTTGRIDPQGNATALDLQGQMAYDWDQLMSRLDASWAEKIRLSGRGARPFAIRGTMRPAADGSVSIADLSGEGQLTWEQATLYGMPLTANDLSARFAQGQGQLGPLDLTVAQGRVHLAPQLDFRQQALLMLPAGRVVDQVKLTPDVCQQLLKYAVPLAADAAEMDGEFSLDVAENVWPLAAPQSGQARGTLTIHHARIEPGPLAGRLTTMIEQVRAVLERRAPVATNTTRVLLEFPQQQIALTQAQGRVFHDRMTVRVNDLDLVTGGSVGFDETLQLAFLLPIQEKWVRGTPALAKLAGQTLRIPVTGTLKQPQIDPSVLTELARQAAGSSIEKVIDDTVQKQLDRFLPRRN